MFALIQYQFIQNAFLAGTFVAVIAAIVGYFLLVRGLTFAGHALSEIGFTGAAGALVLGVNPLYGLLFFTIISGIGIGLLGKRLRERDLTVGILMMFMLGLGSLFIALYNGYAQRAYSILFGTILGISRVDVLITIGFSLVTFIALVCIFRPLLFSSFDQEVAEARGLPVKFISILFLILLAITVSMSVQVVGVILIFTLLVGPAATAIRLAHEPMKAIALSVFLAVLYTWLGIFFAVNGTIPVSFYIAAIAFIVYFPVRLLTERGKG
ncbi:MAG: metal ABC transporter permease [Candidatus Levyibacteriota bacterium]|jgi:zinc/manganese transport system permease protein